MERPITWKDHVTNMEMVSRTGQQRLQDIGSLHFLT